MRIDPEAKAAVAVLAEQLHNLANVPPNIVPLVVFPGFFGKITGASASR